MLYNYYYWFHKALMFYNHHITQRFTFYLHLTLEYLWARILVSLILMNSLPQLPQKQVFYCHLTGEY